MNLDIRIPIGLLFSVIGVLLTVFGVATMAGMAGGAAIYERSLGININLLWGIVMLAFGLVMYFAGRRGSSTVRRADKTPENQGMEAREGSNRQRH